MAHTVRILSRHPERAAARFGRSFEIVGGDVDDRESVARAAAASGVDRLSIVSGASVCEANAWFPMTRAKLEAERAVQRSGVPYTIFPLAPPSKTGAPSAPPRAEALRSRIRSRAPLDHEEAAPRSVSASRELAHLLADEVTVLEELELEVERALFVGIGGRVAAVVGVIARPRLAVLLLHVPGDLVHLT
jgi:uncharacterized protein YbjT (DUF2867 family)